MTMNKEAYLSDSIRNEALTMGRYLLGQPPSPKVIELYERAISNAPTPLTRRDKKLLNFIAKHPWSVGLIDGGLALIDTNSEVRRRSYTMLAITEAMPEYHDYYLPKKRSGWYVLVVAIVGVRGVLRTLAGALLVKVVA